MAKGDHLVAHRRFYTHHGIDCGDGTVIHFNGEPGQPKNNACVRRDLLSDFAKGDFVGIRSYWEAPFSPDEVVSRAESRLGEGNYDLVCNNCEHFATWCIIGVEDSLQVDFHRAAVKGSFVGGMLKSAERQFKYKKTGSWIFAMAKEESAVSRHVKTIMRLRRQG